MSQRVQVVVNDRAPCFLGMGVEQPCSGCSTPCHYVEGGVSTPGGGLIYKLLLGAKSATKTAKKFFSLPVFMPLPPPEHQGEGVISYEVHMIWVQYDMRCGRVLTAEVRSSSITPI